MSFKHLLSTFNKLTLSITCGNHLKISQCQSNRFISSTAARNNLMEFFDDKKNWGANEVKSGRSWKKEELRLKSNTDLHKLWYVLLKERNMLLTMEEEAKSKCELFPSPERLDKVEDSMENLEAVVRERNVAYNQLETGETGEQPGRVRIGPFGIKYYYKYKQHLIPEFLNKAHREKFEDYFPTRDTEQFLLKYRERLYLTKMKQKRRNFNHVVGLLKRFPNMDMQALKEQYPDVDIEKAKASRKCRGHFIPQ